MVEKVTSAFDNVVVLFNIGNVMEMGWIDEYESIKAAAIIWIPGEFGMTAVPQMLEGKVNPSGRLTDTISYKIEDHPSSECFGSYQYNGGKNFVACRKPCTRMRNARNGNAVYRHKGADACADVAEYAEAFNMRNRGRDNVARF